LAGHGRERQGDQVAEVAQQAPRVGHEPGAHGGAVDARQDLRDAALIQQDARLEPVDDEAPQLVADQRARLRQRPLRVLVLQRRERMEGAP
jgi:hypothetical protein